MEFAPQWNSPAAATAVRDAMHDVDANLPVVRIITQKSQTEGTLQNERSLSTLSSAFGILALLLGALGCTALQRIRGGAHARNGIRMALGARPADVHRMVTDRNAAALGGVVIGLVVLCVSRAWPACFWDQRRTRYLRGSLHPAVVVAWLPVTSLREEQRGLDPHDSVALRVAAFAPYPRGAVCYEAQ